MDENCYVLNNCTIESLENDVSKTAITQLEHGKILYLPSLPFPLLPKDNALLTDTILEGTRKNISYDWRNDRLGGFRQDEITLKVQLQSFMKRYAEFARKLVDIALPDYQNQLLWGRTSYRPAEIRGRTSSKRKDDTRVHVDSFPATPVNGLRILRVFCNINPYGEPRVWNTGEPFSEVLEQFAPGIQPYSAYIAKILYWIKATKTLRSAYDHYMLQLHDQMKLDDHYQQNVRKSRLEFPPYSTWIVFTDQVSHAALSGQYLLEQTFYLPVEAMAHPELSPLKQWETYRCTELV